MKTISIPIPEFSFTKILGVQRRTQNHKDGFTVDQLLAVLKDCANEYSWTPDALELERVDYQPVFIYCNLMRGGTLYPIIEPITRTKDDDGKSINPYVYTKDTYEVWQTNDGRESYPIALTSSAQRTSPFSGTIQVSPKQGRVKGKLYYVRSDLMKNLDRQKLNGVLFRRRKVSVLVPYRFQIKDKIPGWESYTTGCTLSDERVYKYMYVWMYQGRHTHWDPLLDGGFNLGPCNLRHPASPKPWSGSDPYYYFNAWEVANK